MAEEYFEKNVFWYYSKAIQKVTSVCFRKLT
jgi:hypothetical protein